jgi:hypothetical protein
MLKSRSIAIARITLMSLGAAIAAVAMMEEAMAQGTAQQQMACQSDAFRLCSQYIPDPDNVRACMVKQMRNLSPDCRAEFREGGGARRVTTTGANAAIDRQRPM